MTPAQKELFLKCQQAAQAIVSVYRASCPEGIDPQASWIAVGGTVLSTAVSAGGQYLAGQQQQDAISGAADALQNPTLFEPETISSADLLKRTYDDVYNNVKTAKHITGVLNEFDYSQAVKYLNRIQPSFGALQNQIGENTLSFSRGQLPADVVSSIQRGAAQQGIQGGFGYGSQGFSSGMGANLNLRNLGLTSLDLSKYGTQLGINVNAAAKGLLPNLGSVRDWLLSLPQQIDLAKYNTDIENTAGQFNTQLQNQAQQAQAQGVLQSGLTGAANTAGLGQTLGSAIGGIGSLFTGGASSASPSMSWLGSGMAAATPSGAGALKLY